MKSFVDSASKNISILFYILTALFIVIVITGGIYSCNKKPSEQKIVKEDSVSVNKIKVVFVVFNKDIDFDKMPIDEIVDHIQKDSILEIKQVSPEVLLKPRIIKVYRVEDITCPYLKERFKNSNPGELVYEYSGKFLIKLNDGVIKVYRCKDK